MADTSEFGRAADQLSAMLARAQTHILGRGFRAHAGVLLNPGARTDQLLNPEDTSMLVFGKCPISSIYGLYIVNTEDIWTPLLQASVLTRIRAARRIPVLIDALRENEGEILSEMRAATEDLAQFLNELEPK